METLDNDLIYTRGLAELEATRQRERDLVGFLRVYAEFKGAAFSMPEGAAAPTTPPPLVPPPSRREVRPAISLADRGLSISEAAEKVLRNVGEPMKARAIAETMLDWEFPYEGSVHDLRASVGGVLAREVREGGPFTKVRTGTFGLKEWLRAAGRIQEEEEDVADGGGEGDDEDGAGDSALEDPTSLFEDVDAEFRPTEDDMS